MKNRNITQSDIFAALPFLTAVIIGIILGADAITWGSSFDEGDYRHAICLIIGAVSGLIIGLADKPKAWTGILHCYLGLPVGIIIASIIYAIQQGHSLYELLFIPLVTFGFYVFMPFLNLLFTGSFILTLVIVRIGKLIIRKITS